MIVNYLLDTNVCIEIMRGRHLAIKKRLAALPYDQITICSIVWTELD